MKHTAIALALSFAFISSVQAENRSPEVEIIKTDNQRWHFRRVSVNPADTELTRRSVGSGYRSGRIIWTRSLVVETRYYR